MLIAHLTLEFGSHYRDIFQEVLFEKGKNPKGTFWDEFSKEAHYEDINELVNKKEMLEDATKALVITKDTDIEALLILKLRKGGSKEKMKRIIEIETPSNIVNVLGALLKSLDLLKKTPQYERYLQLKEAKERHSNSMPLRNRATLASELADYARHVLQLSPQIHNPLKLFACFFLAECGGMLLTKYEFEWQESKGKMKRYSGYHNYLLERYPGQR